MKKCGLGMIEMTNRSCQQENCSWWVSSTKMCVIQDIANTLRIKNINKQIKE